MVSLVQRRDTNWIVFGVEPQMATGPRAGVIHADAGAL